MSSYDVFLLYALHTPKITAEKKSKKAKVFILRKSIAHSPDLMLENVNFSHFEAHKNF